MQSLPKEMDFKPPKDKSWSGSYQIAYYPSEIDPDLKQSENIPEPIGLFDKENKPELNNETDVIPAGNLENGMR